MEDIIRVGILGLSQRIGRFNELGVRSWEEAGCAEVQRGLIPEEEAEHTFFIHRPLVIRPARAALQKLLREWCDAPHVPSRCDLILTVGGCGLGTGDVMPEAMQAVLSRPLPQIAAFVRYASYQAPCPEAVLSRAVAGVRRGTLLINLPGPNPEMLACIMNPLAPLLPALVRDTRAARRR